MLRISKKLRAEIDAVEKLCKQDKVLLTGKALAAWAKANQESQAYKEIYKDKPARAAEKWYEHEASRLIRYYVEDSSLPERIIHRREFISSPLDRMSGGGFRRATEVIRNVRTRDACRADIFNKISSVIQQGSYDRGMEPFFDALNEFCDGWRESLGLPPRVEEAAIA